MNAKTVYTKVLEAAGDLFQLRGYTGVGINEIISTAGVSKDGFYQNFSSKENLCIAWLRETHARSEHRHSEILADPSPVPEKVEGYFGALGDLMRCRQFRGCPFSNTASVTDSDSVEIRREIESHKIFVCEFFADLVRPMVGDETAEKLGNHLFLLYSGATTEAQNLRSEWPIQTAAELARCLCDQAVRVKHASKKNDLLGV